MAAGLVHEEVRATRGARSGLPIVVAVHSTVLGQAVGGCRLWTYPDWRDGLEDALRLAEAMTLKCALAELPHGGGKSVIALPPGLVLEPSQRRDAMLDLGDCVAAFDGRYAVAEDVGTTADDMLIARERTEFAYCTPTAQGGIGEPSEPTALGVYSAIAATLSHVFGDRNVAGRHVTIIGLGQVGGRLARRLSADGAVLTVTDVDSAKRALAAELGARWVAPEEALGCEADLVVPAALGGFLTADVIDRLRCRAIIGPANNQLHDDELADLLHRRGIVWAPDFLVNAGGAIYGTIMEIGSRDRDDAMARVEGIGARLAGVLADAQRRGITPLAAACELARRRIDAARASR